MATSKKFDDEVMLENCDSIVIFPVYGQFGGIWKPDSRTWSIKLLLSLIAAFGLTKTENRKNWKADLKNQIIAFFIIFIGLSAAKNCPRHDNAPINLGNFIHLARAITQHYYV